MGMAPVRAPVRPATDVIYSLILLGPLGRSSSTPGTAFRDEVKNALAGRADLQDGGVPSRRPPGGATTRPLVGRAPGGRVRCASSAAHERPRGRAAPGRRDGTWNAAGVRRAAATTGHSRAIEAGQQRSTTAQLDRTRAQVRPLPRREKLVPKLITRQSQSQSHSSTFGQVRGWPRRQRIGTSRRWRPLPNSLSLALTSSTSCRLRQGRLRRRCAMPPAPLTHPTRRGERHLRGSPEGSWHLGRADLPVVRGGVKAGSTADRGGQTDRSCAEYAPKFPPSRSR
jgi:hypothetical protein